ncbi:MAG: hypothetical protein IRZ21_02790 [Thermoleophilaceae bacterium]|nr:hypothetical protein [Thermoleophilaceae bacterium]
MNRRMLAVPVTLGIAAAAIGCGSSGGGSSGTSAGSSSSQGSSRYGGGGGTTSGAATVNLRNGASGTFLVDSKGMTLYLFQKDTGSSSTCSGACAAAWPPFKTSGKPKAGAGVQASLLGTTKRSDGSTEVTYNGHPLYYYAGDAAPGDTTGQGLNQFGALWYVLNAKGGTITATL